MSDEILTLPDGAPAVSPGAEWPADAASLAPLTVFTTTWCGYCHRLKRQLERAGIGFEEVDIEEDPRAEAWVKSVNAGNAVVPTVRYADGSVETNPSLAQVQARHSR